MVRGGLNETMTKNINNVCFMQGCKNKPEYKATPKPNRLNEFEWMNMNDDFYFYCSKCKSYQEKHNAENWTKFEKLDED